MGKIKEEMSKSLENLDKYTVLPKINRKTRLKQLNTKQKISRAT